MAFYEPSNTFSEHLSPTALATRLLISFEQMNVTDDPYPYPHFYVTAMHVSTVLSVLITTTAVYCIIWKSTQSMAGYSRLLLIHVAWACTCELFFNTAVIPWICTPHIAGMPIGLFTYFGMSTMPQIFIVLHTMAGTVCSVIHLFIFRLGSLVQNKFLKESKYRNRGMLLLYIFVQFAAFGVGYTLLDQDTTMEKENGKKIWDELPKEIDNPYFIVFSTRKFDTMTYTVFTCVYILFIAAMLICFYCCIWSFRILKKMANRLSTKTMNLQRDYLIAVTVQVVVFMVGLMLPALGVITPLVLQKKWLEFTNLMCFLLSINGTADAVAMLIFVKPYRKAICRPFGKLLPVEQKTTVGVITVVSVSNINV